MEDQERREHSEEEKRIIAQREQERKSREAQKDRINRDEKIRCPCCRKNMYYSEYLVNKIVASLMCPKCGVLFVDQEKLKIIKRNISDAKKSGHVNLVQAPPQASSLILPGQKLPPRR